jgi:signal transduction histidine kinase
MTVSVGGRPGTRRVLVLVAVLAAVAVILAWGTFQEVQSGGREVEALMTAHARSIADVVAESGRHSLESYLRWENEIAGRLVDNARWVALQDSASSLGSAQLARFAEAHHLLRINLFDARGNRVATSSPEEDHGDILPRHHPRDYIAPILEGRAATLRIGFKPARYLPGRRFAVAVARPGGGAVVVNVDADTMLAALENMNPGHLFRTLGEAHGVRYLAIQNGDGILAASPGAAEYGLSGADDPAFAGLRTEDHVLTRELDAPGGKVFEVARLVHFPGEKPAVLRVGLDDAPLLDARSDLRRRAWMRSIIFLITAGLGGGLLLAWQRHGLLDREMARARAELTAAAEEARRTEKLAAMGALASGVAHEIRNPLNTIHMIAQALGRDAALPAEVREDAGHVRSESERIEGIVQQFLEFARPRPPRPDSFDAGEVVATAARAQEAALSAAGLNLVVEADHIPVRLDREFLVEIVENLVRNAREASPSGGTVRVIARRRRDAAEVSVEDEGEGVPEEVRPRIFDLYFTTKAGGSGLGLSLVSRMVSDLGGTVRLDPAHARGARFVVRLPLDGEAP